MNTLPTEIRVYILSFFSEEFLISTFKSVSKEWFHYTQQLVTQYAPAVRFQDLLGDAQLAVLARDYPNITSLDISKCNSLGYTGLKVLLTQFPNLKSIALPNTGSQAGEIFYQPLCPSVTRLDIRAMNTHNPHGGGEDNKGCAHVPKAFPNLEELLIPSDGYRNVDNKKLLQYNVKSVTTTAFKRLNISSESITSLTLTRDFENVDLKDCKNLQSLFLEVDAIDSQSLASIPNIEKLTVKTHILLDPLIELLVSNKLRQLWYVEFIYPEPMKPEQLQRLVTSCQHVKKLVLVIPAYPTGNYLRLESTALELKKTQTRMQIIVQGGERRYEKFVPNPSPEYEIPTEESTENIACSFCHQSVKKCDITDHYNVCLHWPGWACMMSEYGCPAGGMSREERRQHLKSCNYYEYHCHRCDVTGKIDSYAQHCRHYVHYNTCRDKSAILQCANKVLGCVAVLSSHDDLMRHMRECTADKGDYTCKACDKDDIESRAALVKHLHEECQGDKKKRLVSDEGQAVLNEIAQRMAKEMESGKTWVDPFTSHRRLNWSW